MLSEKNSPLQTSSTHLEDRYPCNTSPVAQKRAMVMWYGGQEYTVQVGEAQLSVSELF
jgi:hypothetical protein